MDTEQIILQLHPLERKVFPLLKHHTDVQRLVNTSGLLEIEVLRALQWLSNKGLVKIKEELDEVLTISSKGKDYTAKELPERRFLNAIMDEALELKEIKKRAALSDDEATVAIGLLKKNNAIEIKKAAAPLFMITATGKIFLTRPFDEEIFFEQLKKNEMSVYKVPSSETNLVDSLLKRNLIIKELRKQRQIELTDLGKKMILLKLDEEVIDQLTSEMLRENTWKGKKFRRYDVTSSVPKVGGGKRHFVYQTIEYVKQIWLELGFREMYGNNVQTSFWDLDALFVPQDHPAREMQDTFYVKDPAKGKLPPLWKKIKDVHEYGGATGSKGWQAAWSSETAKELLLRTHTTVLSAQTLSQLKKEDLPQKFFSVGKVWRNEALDWKHLFEFYQVDGIVVDEHANFKHLLAYLKEFFGKMGYKDARIRPAHFPYTYLSGEVDVLHPEKNQWIELGGCGIFRPEVTVPLLGFECPVLAWGLGLERIICPYYGITDLRDIYKNDIKMLREAKIWLK